RQAEAQRGELLQGKASHGSASDAALIDSASGGIAEGSQTLKKVPDDGRDAAFDRIRFEGKLKRALAQVQAGQVVLGDVLGDVARDQQAGQFGGRLLDRVRH